MNSVCVSLSHSSGLSSPIRSSVLTENASRCFSPSSPARLGLRDGWSAGVQASLKADDVLNTWPEAQVGRILGDYGDERRWKHIARKTVQARLSGGIDTASWRVDVIGRRSFTRSGYSTSGARSTLGTESAENVDMPDEEVVDGVTLRHGFLKNSSVKIHYVECGQATGKLVILVHGWPNFWYVWKNQFKALSEAGYHVIALDLRGYNLSSKPENLESYVRSTVLGDFVRLIDQFSNGDPAIMVGHDWGSTTSWCLAEDHPSKVEKLVTINMGRLSDFSRILSTNLEQLLRSWYIGAFQIPYVAEAVISYDSCLILRQILRSQIPSMSDAEIERHVKVYSIPGAIKGSISFYRAAVRGLWHHPGNVPVVETPVTVIWGDKDRFLLPIVAEPSKETVPNARVVHLPQCGHWPMWDDPQLFNELLLKTIAEEGS